MLDSTGTLKHDIPEHINHVHTWEQLAPLQHSSAVPGGHSSPRQDCAVLAGPGETGNQAMGKYCQLLAENFSDNISSQKITPGSTQACSSHSVILRSGILRGSFVVGSGLGEALQ